MSDTGFKSAEQRFLPAPAEEGGSRPVVVLDLPFTRDTKNFRLFKVDFEKGVDTTTGGFYVTMGDLAHLRATHKVRVTIEAVR